MTEPIPNARPVSIAPSSLAFVLYALAVISVVLGLAGGLTVLTLATISDSLHLVTVLWMVMSLAAGCSVAGLLWALGSLCHRAQQQAAAERRMVSALERLAGRAGDLAAPAAGGAPPDAPPGIDPDEPSLAALVREVRELNVNALLSDGQRQLKRQYLTERQAETLARQVDRAAADGDLDEADRQFDALVRLAPDWPQRAALRERIDHARSEAEALDVKRAGEQAETFMAAGDFAQAEAVAAQLLARRPAAVAATALLARVRREAETFTSEQRLAMFKTVEKHAQSRQWRAAVAAADELVAAHPDSAEADAIRARMPTLTDNARIEEVRELRDRIRDLIERRRYGEALHLARDVVERFPATAAAAELTEQMSRLEALAADEDEKP